MVSAAKYVDTYTKGLRVKRLISQTDSVIVGVVTTCDASVAFSDDSDSVKPRETVKKNMETLRM